MDLPIIYWEGIYLGLSRTKFMGYGVVLMLETIFGIPNNTIFPWINSSLIMPKGIQLESN